MKPTLLHHLLLLLVACGGIAPAIGAGGKWELLQRSVGVSAMHMQLLHNDRVILFDRTNFGPSNLTFPPGHPCRVNPQDKALPQGDCTAHSAEYDVASNTFRALSIFTDTWCSSGYVAPDGTLVQTGGWEDGYRKVRLMPACSGNDDDASCDWNETPGALAQDRWYATNQKLPDGRAIIVGGLGQASYEFYDPKTGPSGTSIFLPFLSQTNSLYPFVHLNIDGNLFIYANNRAILFDYKNGRTVREYPALPVAEPRNNPNAGSSVLLPLKPNPTEAEVLVCGGAPADSFNAVQRGEFRPALRTCARIKITDPAPSWEIETMPSPRVMGDMILLPNGDAAIINGAEHGLGGWESARTPAKAPVVYRTGNSPGSRFEEQSPAGVARMYHSSAVLLRDGRVLVGGSNPHQFYVFGDGVEFPTELGLEAFSPGYLDPSSAMFRPKIVGTFPARVTYGQVVKLRFAFPAATGMFGQFAARGAVSVTMVAPSFTTHTFAQGQRLLFLEVNRVAVTWGGIFEASVVMPSKPELAPPGYYMVFLVNEHRRVTERIPSEGIWVHIQ